MLPDGNKIYVFDKRNHRDRQVGVVKGNVYYTERRQNHFFRKFNGWGIGARAIKALARYNAKYVIFRYYWNNSITDFGMPLEDFILAGDIWVDANPNSITDEEQIVCDVKYMTRTVVQ